MSNLLNSFFKYVMETYTLLKYSYKLYIAIALLVIIILLYEVAQRV